MALPAGGGDKKNIIKMAYIYFQEGRWDKAIEEYQKLLALDPEDINTHNMLGDVYVKKGSIREAYEEYVKVSNNFSARGQADKALIVNKKLAALDPAFLPPEGKKKQNLIRQTVKAESALENEDWDGAIEAFGEVIKLDPDNLDAWAKLGDLYEKKGDIPEAVRQYSGLGELLLKNRLYKKAQEVFQKAVQLDPGNVGPRLQLAQINVKQGSESDAKKDFLAIAEIFLGAGDFEKAQLYAAKAVEFKSIEAHYILGLVFLKKQQLSEAKSQLESLLRFKVSHVGALSHLALILMEQNQLDKAVENVQKAMKIEGDNPTALEVWANLSLKKGSKADAVATLTKLAEIHSAKGDPVKAMETLREILAIDNDFLPANIKIAELLAQSGDKVKAAGAYLKVGAIFEKQNNKDRAAEFFRKSAEVGQEGAQEKGEAEPPPAAETEAKPVSPPEPVLLEPEPPVEKVEKKPPPVPQEAPVAAPPGVAGSAAKDKRVASGTGTAEELKAQMAIADDYAKQGLVEEAIEIYQQLAETYPDSAPALKAKLNQVYTAYARTGEDVLGALEAEKKAKEEEERHFREEMDRKTQEEAKKLRTAMEQKARAEAERQAREESDRKVREEAKLKAEEEIERRVREEIKKREEAKREKEELERKVKEKEELERLKKVEPAKPAMKKEETSHREGSAEKGQDEEFMTVAVAEIYERNGLHDEAMRIYRRIAQLEPDNLEVKRKLREAENLVKPKSVEPASSPKFVPPPPPPSGSEKDSHGKKKPNKIGYV